MPWRCRARLRPSAPARSAKDHRRDRPVHDLAHGEARLDPRNPGQPRQLGSVNAFEVLDVARHDDDDVVVAAGHQEAAHHRWTLDDRGFERFQRILVLAFQRDPDQHGGGEAKARQIQDGLIAADEAFLFQRLCRRAIAVLESPTRSARPTWLTRALAASSDRIAVSIWSICSSFICLDSCADSWISAGFWQKIAINHRNCKNINQNPTYILGRKKECPAMRVGVPKEIKVHEYRVGLTPGAVREYAAAGHSVIVEPNAGAGIGASDEVDRTAGASIASTPPAV